MRTGHTAAAIPAHIHVYVRHNRPHKSQPTPSRTAGDFHQKPTTCGTPLHVALLDKHVQRPDAQTGKPKKPRKKKKDSQGVNAELAARASGVDTFGALKHVRLETTHRFRNDREHGENMAEMRNTESEQPVSDRFCQSLQPLSEEEKSDPKYRFAPIGVVSNLERGTH